MKETRTLKLERPARKGGGDRYEEIVPAGKSPIVGMLYINQNFSRPGPKENITLTLEDEG